jgi:hypothetical protein
MKIQIKKQEDESTEGFKRGDLLEGFKGVFTFAQIISCTIALM